MKRTLKRLRELYQSISFKLFILLSIFIMLLLIILIYINLNYFAGKMEGCLLANAIQSSNLVKNATRNSMLHNQREDLASIIVDMVRVQHFTNIRIYNKKGRIEFSSDSSELYQIVDKHDEQCIFCHDSEHTKGTLPIENRFRKIKSDNGHTMLGLINPIENEPECYNAACHVHSKEQKILGVLDFQVTLDRLEKNKAEVRMYAVLIFMLISAITIFVFSRLIHTHIKRPIAKFTKGTQQIAKLNLNHSITVSSPIEMARLSESFNMMVEKLRDAQDALKDWSETLEQRVESKTAELKKAHEQLVRSEKLSSMGKLAATVAHEINNPLSGVFTYSKLLIRQMENYHDPDQFQDTIKNLKVIRDESQRCGDIVQNMLLFAKSSYGKRSLYNLQDIAHKSIQLVRHSIDMKNVNLIKNFLQSDIIMECDGPAIEQMLVALLINAVEACPDKNGELKIAIRSDYDVYAEITISDNGNGIDEELLPHIFEPFFSTKGGEHSVGLGLAVVYGIVENHYGTINVESEKGQGTTFRIQMPINLETK